MLNTGKAPVIYQRLTNSSESDTLPWYNSTIKNNIVFLTGSLIERDKICYGNFVISVNEFLDGNNIFLFPPFKPLLPNASLYFPGIAYDSSALGPQITGNLCYIYIDESGKIRLWAPPNQTCIISFSYQVKYE